MKYSTTQYKHFADVADRSLEDGIELLLCNIPAELNLQQCSSVGVSSVAMTFTVLI
jgi:hypothetical protein